MKKLLILLFAATISLTACTEKSINTPSNATSREEVDANPHIVVSTMSTYNGHIFIAEEPETPKGFEPVFIAGYLRHGSRMEADESYPVEAHDYFKKADEAGLLTPLGKKVYEYMEWFLNEHKDCVGDLTDLGYQQHKQIASRFYKRFPSLFKGESKTVSRGSVSLRATFSMVAFNEGLKECNTRLNNHMKSSPATTSYIRPQKADFNKHFSHAEEKEYKAFLKKEVYSKLIAWGERQDMDHCKKALFTDPDKFFALFDAEPFYILTDIYKRMAFAQNLGVDDRSLIDEVFTPEERHIIYKHENCRWYYRCASAAHPILANYLAQSRYTVERLFAEIDTKIKGENDTNAFLCFGHDLNIIPLMTVLGMDRIPLTFGKDVESVDFIAEHWRSYKYTPKAANMMLVIYRNNEGKVLVRPLVNERDVEVDIESATPHYYDWDEFKKFAYARLDTVDLLTKR
jgi:hypothetical protein